MAVKKAAATAKKAPARKPVARKKAATKAVGKGQSYECEVCGLAVTVDEVCGCVETCDILCCDQPMKEKKAKVKAKPKAAAKK